MMEEKRKALADGERHGKEGALFMPPENNHELFMAYREGYIIGSNKKSQNKKDAA